MPRYTVEWNPDLETAFTELWLSSHSQVRHLLTRIAFTIDAELSAHPERTGRPVPSEPGLRVWILSDFEKLIQVSFRVREEDRVVRVVSISVAR
jgi:hypothetical protein